MPSFSDLAAAAKELAAVVMAKHSMAGAAGTAERLFWVADTAARRPEDFGYPRSYPSRPNWTANDIRREISAVLWGKPTHPSRIAPCYAGLPFRQLAEIADGRIASLWFEAPTTADRHEFLSAVAANRRYRGMEWQGWLASPLSWVVRHCPVGDFVPRDMAIANWLVAKKTWAGWSRPLPVGYGPDGQMRTVSPVAMLDEVTPADLVGGPKTNPERVFRAVLARTSADALAEIARQNAPLPAMPWTTVPGVEQITTAAGLVAEGQRMGHCVGGYSSACRAGRAYIIRLPNSTAEITPSGDVYQHRAIGNAVPPKSDIDLLEKWVRNRKVK